MSDFMSVIETKERPTIPRANYYEGQPEGFHVFSFSPTPEADVAAGKPQVRATQVHLHIPMDWGRLLFRFKGPGTLDSFIDALVEHREYVWGKR